MKGIDFLESIACKLSKVHFDLSFLDLNRKIPATLRLELSLTENSLFSSEFRRRTS